MFRVIKIGDIVDGTLDEESMTLQDAFFFTIKNQNYYLVYDKAGEIIGKIPLDYFMFFKIDDSPYFEDIDIENALRLHEQGIKYQIVGSTEDSHKIKLINSMDIAKFELIEDSPMHIPFTNSAFDSDGIVIFKNMNSLADSLDPEEYL